MRGRLCPSDSPPRSAPGPDTVSVLFALLYRVIVKMTTLPQPGASEPRTRAAPAVLNYVAEERQLKAEEFPMPHLSPQTLTEAERAR